ncbi:hypothetical protein THAOC_23714 [Thalassiosira oceanica]|uniref:Uncharacterized protein n=1 Tax=Thalassiosira oceanica TaxID=159749 RepID=K0RVC0_THAOC|nr:hypothetical protein THAOC_23714 [Thalassiosira oceanica]|eukprot:EJK56399.1 hypothetical protein THAOC_23714 [Thalassiosira oceanica]
MSLAKRCFLLHPERAGALEVEAECLSALSCPDHDDRLDGGTVEAPDEDEGIGPLSPCPEPYEFLGVVEQSTNMNCSREQLNFPAFHAGSRQFIFLIIDRGYQASNHSLTLSTDHFTMSIRENKRLFGLSTLILLFRGRRDRGFVCVC